MSEYVKIFVKKGGRRGKEQGSGWARQNNGGKLRTKTEEKNRAHKKNPLWIIRMRAIPHVNDKRHKPLTRKENRGGKQVKGGKGR